MDIALDYVTGVQYVTWLLDQAATFQGYPAAVKSDGGPEFTGRAFISWMQAHGERHLLMEPVRTHYG